jgi:hypothetical protein
MDIKALMQQILDLYGEPADGGFFSLFDKAEADGVITKDEKARLARWVIYNLEGASR